MAEEQFRAELSELRTQNQQLQAALMSLQQQAAQQQGLVNALAELPQTLAALPATVGAAVAAASTASRGRPTLVDTKGLGKPPQLKNTEQDFVAWARRVENFVVSVHPGAREILTWAVELDPSTAATPTIAAREADGLMEERNGQTLL